MSVRLIVLVTAPSPSTAEQPTEDSGGFRVHRVESVYQTADTTVRVLLPKKFRKDKHRRVL